MDPIINLPYRFGVPTTGPPFPLATFPHVAEGCDLCFPVATRSLLRRPVRCVSVHLDIRIILGISSPCRFGVPTTGPPVPLSTLLHFTEGCDLC